MELPLVINMSKEEEMYQALGAIKRAGINDGMNYIMENGFKFGSTCHLFLKKSLFNHSCFSNAGIVGAEGRRVVALRDIEAGEEICISYIGGVLHSKRSAALFLPNKFRKPLLDEIFKFKCLCNRCQGTACLELEQSLARSQENLWPSYPHNVLEDAGPEFRGSLLKLLEGKTDEEIINRYAAFLPAAACLTLDKKILTLCKTAFERFTPKNFPTIARLQEMIELA
jgi:hypothetical protein